MLQIEGCLSESCDGIGWTDTTGQYPDPTTGYGAQNGVTGPADFDTYSLRIWAPSLNPATDDPSYTYDLKALAPSPDADGNYVYTFDIGLQVSGVWFARAVGVKDGDTYEVNQYPILTEEVKGLVYAALNEFDPSCECSEGCVDPRMLFLDLLTVRPCDSCGCNTVCSLNQIRRIIANLYAKLPLCGC